ncbi:helix-turn-helix domain-containing protein [Streptomyces sp. NPDC005863]|uniref:AraC family transcriptional regulator n=1 Tax=unclassified Streptomyces TaxID=2593676 RepID=UPI0033F02D93
MRLTTQRRDDPAAWDVARPRRRDGVPGVDVAGFRVFGPLGPLSGGLRIVPHPAVMLVLAFGPGRPAVDDGAGRRHRGSLVAGPGFGSGGAVRAWGEDVACVQVRLSPPAAGAILGVCPADLDGAVVRLDDVWGRRAAQVCERLAGLDTWQERFAYTEAELARRCAGRAPVDPAVAWAWRRIVDSGSLVRVERLADDLGWSRKRLWSRFRDHLGMPPKQAARLVRFDHAVHRLVAGAGPAGVAADTGYCDQSHLHRDVVAFTGATPAAVAGEPFLTVDDRAWPTAPRV